jgi:hypothetical protein
MHSIYDNVEVSKSIAPQSDAGGSALNGAGVDTLGYNTAMLVFETGAASGSPSAISIDVRLQESDDNTNWSDAIDNSVTVIGGAVTEENHVLLARIEGLGLNRKRYLRVIETTTFTGGTSPAIEVHSNILLDRSEQKPTNTGVSNT